jgi:hypothetical protein
MVGLKIQILSILIKKNLYICYPSVVNQYVEFFVLRMKFFREGSNRIVIR